MTHDELCDAQDMDVSRVTCWRCRLIGKARADERQRILKAAESLVRTPTLQTQRVLAVIRGHAS